MSEHELWNELGNLYFLSGEYGQAVHAYRRSIQMDESFGRPYSNLALTYVQQGKYEQAVAALLNSCLDNGASLPDVNIPGILGGTDCTAIKNLGDLLDDYNNSGDDIAIIELGMPFSDPMADGPAIQASSQRALRSGQTMKKTLRMVKAFRSGDDTTPLVLMGY